MAHVTGNSQRTPFTTATAESVLAAACEITDLDTKGARLLRLGENALFHLPARSVVVRIARTMDYWPDAVKEVAVARWLARHQFSAAQVLAISQPIRVADHPVTFWQYIEGRNGTRSDIVHLATLLRRLHELPRPTSFDLPREDILGRVRKRIEVASVSSADKDFLLTRLGELEAKLPHLRYPFKPAPTHGDAHVQNLMFSDRQSFLIDFERFAWGQPEWDLSMTATEYKTAGWWSESEYEQFVEAYGYDVVTWTEGFPVLRAVHEIKMTTWLMQNIGESPEISSEYAKRMRTIRDAGAASERWQPF